MPDYPTRGLLFDSDGVLVDSHAAAAIAWNTWAKTWAPSFDFDRDIVHGTRMGDSVAELVDPSVFAEAERELVAMELATTDYVVAMPGAADLLASLDDDWAVVTSALRDLARARLAAAGLRTPHRLVSAEDVTTGKPGPAPYLAGAALLGLHPRDCTVFEDAPAGIASALAAGIGTIVGIGRMARGHGATITVPDLRSVSYRDGVLGVAETVSA